MAKFFDLKVQSVTQILCLGKKKKQKIESKFDKLTLSAIVEYLRLMPEIAEKINS